MSIFYSEDEKTTLDINHTFPVSYKVKGNMFTLLRKNRN